jgi:hypothetical protein
MLGATQSFTATVTNAANTSVTWTVNDIPAGDSAVGTITAAGLYTAPPRLPANTALVVRAISQADSSKSATAAVSVGSDIAISLTPASAAVELGATQLFSAVIQSTGNPDRGVTWSVAGAGCTGAGCGSVDVSGVYTAPQITVSPASVTLTAKSVADPSKTVAAGVTLTSNFTLTVTGPANLETAAGAQYTAALRPAPNSNPSRVVVWSVSGPGCSGPACGVISATGSYTAPGNVPTPPTVVITATPEADPVLAASLAVTIQAVQSVSVQVSPTAATLAVSHRQTFLASVTGAPNQNVQWAVNGVPGGNATLGQICAVASNPCQAATPGANQVDYLAPGSMPAPNPVTLTATSAADAHQTAAAAVTILSHIQVSVAPPSVTLAPASQQAFQATVLGTSSQGVIWQVAGTACNGAGTPCGTIDATGLYTAPLAPPTPNTLNVVALSAEDASRSGTATVTLATGPAILTMLPASATSGAAGGFTLRVVGGNFAASGADPGAAVVINGAVRATNCPDANDCTTILTAGDLANAGMLAVQVRNPDGATSNQALFVVVPGSGNEDIVVLTPAVPSATGKDLVVVDTSTAGSSSLGNNVDLNVAALGLYSTATNSCVLAGNPVFLTRPASGTATAELCAFSLSGLDPGLNYSLGGPTPNDLAIVARQPLGLGIVRLTIELSSTTLAGARTLFVENASKDKTAASGAIQVK